MSEKEKLHNQRNQQIIEYENKRDNYYCNLTELYGQETMDELNNLFTDGCGFYWNNGSVVDIIKFYEEDESRKYIFDFNGESLEYVVQYLKDIISRG